MTYAWKKWLCNRFGHKTIPVSAVDLGLANGVHYTATHGEKCVKCGLITTSKMEKVI